MINGTPQDIIIVEGAGAPDCDHLPSTGRVAITVSAAG
jgi:hypothetical protein